MGYEAIAHESKRNNFFSKIKLVGQKLCLETGNQFGFTEYNGGLQNAIQQPPFCLFTDLLVPVSI